MKDSKSTAKEGNTKPKHLKINQERIKTRKNYGRFEKVTVKR